MAVVSPMDAAKRQAGYLAQTGRRRLTPRQKRRATKKRLARSSVHQDR